MADASQGPRKLQSFSIYWPPAQKESGMRTAGYHVALLLAAVLASGSALLTAGAASAQQQAITATVTGAKIQKVGFRAMIQKETIMYILAGFARNKPDVEAVAALMALIEGRTDDGKVV